MVWPLRLRCITGKGGRIRLADFGPLFVISLLNRAIAIFRYANYASSYSNISL